MLHKIEGKLLLNQLHGGKFHFNFDQVIYRSPF